jgi:hypothetical protein
VPTPPATSFTATTTMTVQTPALSAPFHAMQARSLGILKTVTFLDGHEDTRNLPLRIPC